MQRLLSMSEFSVRKALNHIENVHIHMIGFVG
jgi:hypothetical protein